MLRAVSRVAEHAAATGRPAEDGSDTVVLPLGLVALFWLRMYLPLVRAGLPQAPRNSGPDGLSFAKAGFRQMMELAIALVESRVGAVFGVGTGGAVAGALSEAAATITDMPVNVTRFPRTDHRVFGSIRRRGGRARDALVLDISVLRSWGDFTVPGPVWRSLTRLGASVEPVVVQGRRCSDQRHVMLFDDQGGGALNAE